MSFVETGQPGPTPDLEEERRRRAGRGSSAAPASPGGRFKRLQERYRHSAWAPVALRLPGSCSSCSALAGVGAASILSGLEGVKRAGPARRSWPTSARRGSRCTSDGPPKSLRCKPVRTPRRVGGERRAAPMPELPRNPPGHAGRQGDPQRRQRRELTQATRRRHKRAQSIVKLRKRLKRFRRASDLLRVRGIGARSLQRMLPYLVLDPPREGDAGARS